MALVQTLPVANLEFTTISVLDAQDAVPASFPDSLSSRMAWNGSMLTEQDYIYHLSNAEILEVETALNTFKALELDADLINQENFPLPTLQHVLRVLCDEVHNGKGFFVLRGLDSQRYSVEDGIAIFLGIQSYIAELRARQDDKGNMIVHIISDSSIVTSQAGNLHSRHSKKSITFHTEETGDIIAWQTRNTAARGGSCIISSAHTIYNILATTRPDIIHTLAQPDWPFALPNFHRRPVLFYHDSHLIINFCRAALLGSPAHPRPANLPTLTSKQREALDVLEDTARSVELKINTAAGDIHFVNNLAVLHRRDEFVNDVDEKGNTGADGKKKQRHLVRMRIRNQETGWELPWALQQEWDRVFAEGERVWHLEPMPEGFFSLRDCPL